MKEEKHHNSSGFFWGLIIGAAIGSLVSTKKGRRIIKEISEHGLASLENITNLDDIKNAMEEPGFEEEVDGAEDGMEEKVKQEMKEESVGPEKVETPNKKPKLFRGIRKR